jgi:hypothetical protein
MHTVHAGYSIIAKLKEDKIEIVRGILQDLNTNPGGNLKIPFDKSPSTHFCSGVILPSQKYKDEKLPDTLLVSTSFSGPTKKHIAELIEIGAAALRDLFQHCVDFPVEALSSDNALKRYLEKHRHWETFYTGMQYLTKQDIIRQNQLRNLISSFVDKSQVDESFENKSPQEIRKQIQNHVSNQPGYEWAGKPMKKTFSDFLVLYWSLILFGVIALFFIFSPIAYLIFNLSFFKVPSFILLLFVLSFLVLLFSIRSYEKQVQDVATRPPDIVVKNVATSQRFPVINNMTVSGALKKGALRPLFFKIALKAVIMVRGTLSIPTVYAARWISVDKGKRLVFISNFLNRSETYITDFIDNKKSASKINLLFGQGEGYPVTRWIMQDGAIENPNAFIYEVMNNFHITDFWYCPYHQLSIDMITNNRQISQGLYTNLTEKQTINWLQLL